MRLEILQVGRAEIRSAGSREYLPLFGSLNKKSRIPDIDFWRGIALTLIVIDHIPGCFLDQFTLKNFGFSDAAEVFVFLSGTSVGLVYVSRFQQSGFRVVVNGCVLRALKIYGVHIALTVCAVLVLAVVFAIAKPIVGPERLSHFAADEAFSRFLESPMPSFLDVAMLRYQPSFFDILPLYVTLMLWAPFALALALWDIRVALLVSAGVYVVGRGPLALEPHLELDGWYFNPLAWQLVFTIGIVCAVLWRDGLTRPSPRLLKLSAAVVLAAAIVSTSAVGNFSAIYWAYATRLDMYKPDFGLVRLFHFLALAYLISAAAVTPDLAPGIRQVIDSKFGCALQRMGRNSLTIFAMGTLLSLFGRMVLRAASFATGHFLDPPIGLVIALASVWAVFTTSRYIERRGSARVLPDWARANTFPASWLNRASAVARRHESDPEGAAEGVEAKLEGRSRLRS
jgi:hypothetical protein